MIKERAHSNLHFPPLTKQKMQSMGQLTPSSGVALDYIEWNCRTVRLSVIFMKNGLKIESNKGYMASRESSCLYKHCWDKAKVSL